MNSRQESLIRSLSEGKYFGEKALQIDGSKRTANIIAKSKRVVCLTLEKKDFDKLIGNIGAAQNPTEPFTLSIPPTPRGSLTAPHVPSKASKMRPRHKAIELDELEKVICMGAGAYGRVDLVKSPRLGKVFALKKIQKVNSIKYHDGGLINSLKSTSKLLLNIISFTPHSILPEA